MLRDRVKSVGAFVALAPALLIGGEKKLIGAEWGFETATESDLVKNISRLDETGLDGVVFWPRGRNVIHRIWEEDWKENDYARSISDLKSISGHASAREMFAMSLTSPRKRVDWTDDRLWRRVSENMRILAKMAKSSGIRGLVLDLEDYRKANQFFRQAGELPYVELSKLVRRRAAEIFTPAFREYPEMAIMTYWFLSWIPPWEHSIDQISMAEARGDLWPSFVNGMLDVLPPQAKIIDGNEYTYHSKALDNGFAGEYVRTRKLLLPLVAEENRSKFQNQVSLGFAIYIDMYINPTNTVWHHGETNGSRLETLYRNLENALEVSDEYVWIYGERLQQIRWPEDFRLNQACKVRETWEDRLPGLRDTLNCLKDPMEFLRRKEREAKSAAIWRNLAGEINMTADGIVKWHSCAVTNSIAAEDFYLVRFRGYGEGISGRITWKDAKNAVLTEKGHVYYIPFVRQPDGGKLFENAIRAPAGAAKLELAIRIEATPDENSRFDGVEIVRLTSHGRKDK